MYISVKYFIGDTVYFVHNINSMYHPEEAAYTVKGVNVKVTEESTLILYTIVSKDVTFETSEKFLFSVYEDAKFWAESMNSKGE